jgi:hypothetical protein
LSIAFILLLVSILIAAPLAIYDGVVTQSDRRQPFCGQRSPAGRTHSVGAHRDHSARCDGIAGHQADRRPGRDQRDTQRRQFIGNHIVIDERCARYRTIREQTARSDLAKYPDGANSIWRRIAGLYCRLSRRRNLERCITVLFGAAAFGSIQAIRWAGLARWTIGIFVATITVAAAMIVLWRYNSLRMLSPFLIYNRDIARGDFGRAANIVGHRLAGHRRGNLRAAFAHLPGTRQHRYESSVNRRGVRNRTGVADDPLHYRNDNGACRTPLSRCSRPWTGFFFPAAAAACSIIILCQAFCDTSLLNSCVAVISDAVIGLGLAQSVSHREGP